MTKTINTTPDDVRVSVSSIYSDLLEKRKFERDLKIEKKREEREMRDHQKEEVYEDETKKSKKERRATELDNWKEVIIGLTGDDLEYADDEKKKKSKYKKWIDEEGGDNIVLTPKPKKIKKQNYQKQFEPELNMLKSIVTDQNKFTADLQKRFHIAAGPATKDAPIPNKTLVELASVINAGRSNSLGVLREVGNLKKTIADLYMKQKKLEADTAGGGFNTTDIGLMGSSIASSIFGDSSYDYQATATPAASTGSTMQSNSQAVSQSTSLTPSSNQQVVPQMMQSSVTVEAFDPATWGGPSIASDSMVNFEGVPHEVVVEMDSVTNNSRFKAVRKDTGEEIPNYPIPTSDISKLVINTNDKTVKGAFDEMYRLEML